MKVRVHELAKKYDMGNKEFLNLLKDDIKITVSSHLSGLAEEDVKKIDKYFENINNNKEEMIVKPEKTTSNGKGDSLNKKVVETETDDIFEEEGLGNGKKSQQIRKTGKELNQLLERKLLMMKNLKKIKRKKEEELTLL